MSDPEWLTIARELRALAQTGLAYSRDGFDRQRFERIREIAAGMTAAGSGMDPTKILDLFRAESDYPTPKIDVRAAECVVRELREESGFEGRAVKLAAVWDYARQDHVLRHPASIYKLFFVCEITGGAARASEETTEVGFFADGELPPLSGGRITTRQILRMFEHARRPELPADFD